jgi:hypothetical protein
MANLLKTLFKNKEPTTEEVEAMARANEALKLRMKHFISQTQDRAAA